MMERIKKMEEILLNDLHVTDFIPSDRWNIPEIIYSRFKGRCGQAIELGAEEIALFLQKHYIFDDFDDDGERKKWRLNLETEYPNLIDYFKNNVLDSNSLESFKAGVKLIQDECQHQDIKTAALGVVYIFDSILEGYETNSLIEKYEGLEILKSSARGFLDYIVKKSLKKK